MPSGVVERSLKTSHGLTELHFRLIKGLLEGVPHSELMREEHLHKRQFYEDILQDPVFTAELKDQQRQLREALQELLRAKLRRVAPDALERIIALSEKAIMESTRLKACQDLLDREGSVVPVTRAVVAGAQVIGLAGLTEEQLRALAGGQIPEFPKGEKGGNGSNGE